MPETKTSRTLDLIQTLATSVDKKDMTPQQCSGVDTVLATVRNMIWIELKTQRLEILNDKIDSAFSKVRTMNLDETCEDAVEKIDELFLYLIREAGGEKFNRPWFRMENAFCNETMPVVLEALRAVMVGNPQRAKDLALGGRST